MFNCYFSIKEKLQTGSMWKKCWIKCKHISVSYKPQGTWNFSPRWQRSPATNQLSVAMATGSGNMPSPPPQLSRTLSCHLWNYEFYIQVGRCISKKGEACESGQSDSMCSNVLEILNFTLKTICHPQYLPVPFSWRGLEYPDPKIHE